ncbi:hypothetical protein [Aurantiacibacter hainanensis]|uniref:hypothetical protein n=1 Tax=Aurantiacibacter hainanensis TaxID=3076114 RepID=UPI0030C6C461
MAAAGVAACAASAASAQDYSLDPTYGSVTLEAGFTPDPFTVNLSSGGSREASSAHDSCRGYIANAPDYRLNYESGGFPLIISVDSNVDTTLVVNGPNGSWHCDDDSGEKSLNPMVRIDKPMSGQYDIWVGTYGSDDIEPAVLQISELSSQ